MALTPDKVKSLLGDLGKATMRGVRRCPKCNTLNGTRGLSCKNPACDMVFKERDKKKGHSAEAVKIITGSAVQVYSVRLRDRGPDYRGFVQLPLVQDLDGNPAENVDPEVLAQAARCYVEACTRNNNVAVNQPHTACSHIMSAIHCVTEAQPLTLKNSVLNSLQVSTDIKQAIWLLATETSGPLVQRVTKNIMVVKCKASSKQLLGFLHFSYFDAKGRMNSSSEPRFHCTCKEFKEGQKPSTSGKQSDVPSKRCVHFYACICAFASDEALSEEFSYFINLDNCLTLDEFVDQIPDIAEPVAPESIVDHVFTVTAEDCTEAFESAATEVSNSDETVEIVQIIEEGIETDQIVETISMPPMKKIRFDQSDSLAQASSALLTLQESAKQDYTTPKKIQRPTTQRVTPVKKLTTGGPIEESNNSISFLSWLGSVTEHVNQSMHYQFDGNPDTLTFLVPQQFFESLQHRIASGHKKKRLPNTTTAFVRRDSLPIGTFTRYTYHITNILHVKQIFDTPDMPLEITRSFVENRDGTFDPYEPQLRQTSQYGKPIRPFELKTYLKVGNTSPDQKAPTPFIIEWVPDILPKSRIGEMKLTFQYGHQRNGHVEIRRSATTAPPSDIPATTTSIISISPKSNHAPPKQRTLAAATTTTVGGTMTQNIIASASGSIVSIEPLMTEVVVSEYTQ